MKGLRKVKGYWSCVKVTAEGEEEEFGAIGLQVDPAGVKSGQVSVGPGLWPQFSVV